MDTKKIQRYIDSVNIAASLSQEKLDTIGAIVVRDYELDLLSRSELDEVNREAMKLAKQTIEKKTFPWPDAANVKYPLITTSAIQFASRAMPELIPDDKIVNIKVVGADPQGAKEERGLRVSRYMDYQVTYEMEDWLDGMDRMFHSLPIIGTCFKKVYYDNLLGRVCSVFLTSDDVVVNSKAKSLKAAQVKTHRFYKYENYAKEMQAAGLWIEAELGVATSADYTEDNPPHLFLEQHRWIDMDGDGYKEPYIVTVHKETSKVMRIVAGYDVESLVLKAGKLIRIEPITYFIKYPFIPNPTGEFYDIGFGTLLFPINSSINTAINQLLDAGTLANSGGGFLARGVRLKAGAVRFTPGEWKKTDSMSQDLRTGVLPLPIREPSQVLFSLLGLLITAGKDISSVQEAMTGQKPGENVSLGTVAALIEQGLKVFNGIYKRIYRSLTEEFKLIYELNSKYLEESKYVAVLDEEVNKSDFSPKDYDICPTAEPMYALETQRVMRAESLLKISGRPGLDEDGITALYLKAVRAPKEFLLPPDQRPQVPNIEIEKLKLEAEKLQLEKDSASLEKMKLFAEIEELRARAVLSIAKAEAEEAGTQLDGYKAFVDELGMYMNQMRQTNGSNSGRTGGVENRPGNEGDLGANPQDQEGILPQP